MKQLILRFDSSELSAVEWVVRDPAGVRGEVSTDPLPSIAAQAVGASVICLVPAVEMLLTRVRLPTRQRRHIRRAVPFALEEQLAAEVEGLHFAVGTGDAEGLFSVAVVARERMQAWLDALEQADIRPDCLLPDVLAVPRAGEDWAALAEPDRTSVRIATDVGYVGERQMARELLAINMEQVAEKPEAVRLFDCGGDVDAVTAVCAQTGVQVRVENCTGGALGVLARGVDQPAINLLQGDYSRREQLGRLWRPWRVPAALLLVWMLLQLVMSGQDYVRLSSRQADLNAQIEEVYRRAFPDARKVVNPQVQMERRLQALRQGGDVGFTHLMATAAPVLQQSPNLQINSLRYNAGVLEVDLTLADLQSLDRLKKVLSERRLAVDITTAAARGDKVEGRLQIRGGGA